MISLTGLVQVVVYLLVAGLIFWLLWFLVNYINPPEPFKKIINVFLMIFAVLLVIGLLLQFVGGAPPLFRP